MEEDAEAVLPESFPCLQILRRGTVGLCMDRCTCKEQSQGQDDRLFHGPYTSELEKRYLRAADTGHQFAADVGEGLAVAHQHSTGPGCLR